MEHTEWEAHTQPSPNSSSSPGPSQPVKPRTKYSFTGYHYLTDASMQGAARSPLRQLYKHGQGHSQQQAPKYEGMQRHLPGQGSAQTQEQSSLNHSGQLKVDDTHASNHAHADGGQQSCEEEDVCRDKQHGRHTPINGHSQDCDAAASHSDQDKHQHEMQQLPPQQQKQHCRFKIIDFGHADLEPVQENIAQGLVKTKYRSLSDQVNATLVCQQHSHDTHRPWTWLLWLS